MEWQVQVQQRLYHIWDKEWKTLQRKANDMIIIHYKSMVWVFVTVALFHIRNDVIKPTINQTWNVFIYF